MPMEQRKLAAILAADVVGYSRLMAADEAGTLSALKTRRKSVLEPLVTKHHGRVFKIAGDGVLVEFASAVSAVQCAVELQQQFTGANADLPDDRQIVLRVGVHVGDVLVEGSDLYGDGINIAARLEALASPGTVLISEDIHRQIGNKLSLAFDDIGPQSLKNMDQPVRAYRISGANKAVAAPRATAGAVEKVSIAVLPFDNMSGDDKETYFSDGITEDIITELSRFRELHVIARNSSFQFRGDKNDIGEIGRALRVKFVVEGSVRRAANRIRITVQLIDAASLGHIWSDRYDREIVDVFEIQEDIARTIAGRVAGRAIATAVERARTRRIETFSAYDLFLRARQMLGTYGTPDGEKDFEAKELLNRTVELDPKFAAAYGLLADIHVSHFLHTGDTSLIDKAVMYGRQGVAADSQDPWANYGLGLALIYREGPQDAGFYLQRAIDLNPNDVTFLGVYAVWLSYVGRGGEALDAIHEAIRRDPYGQEWFWDIQGIVLTIQGMYSEAISSFTKMTYIPPWTQCYLAFCQMKSGDRGQAKAALKEFRTRMPGLSPSALMSRLLVTNPEFRTDFLKTLRAVEVSQSEGQT